MSDDMIRKAHFVQQENEQKLGDAPIEPAYYENMNRIAQVLDAVFNGDNDGKIIGERETGFVLMVFPYGDKTGRCNYISNGANREDVVTLMKEMIARFEGQPEMTGRA